MKIKILTFASQDLIGGYRFYEKQTEGLGTYFLDTLFSDIDSLAVYGGIHPIYFKKYNRALSNTNAPSFIKVLYVINNRNQ